MMQSRKILVLLDVNDEKAIAEDLGTIEYIEREFGWLHDSGISLEYARILDDDDAGDKNAIDLLNKIIEEDK